jgi:hypothetical protein
MLARYLQSAVIACAWLVACARPRRTHRIDRAQLTSPSQCCRGDTIVPNVVLFLPFGTVVLHLNLLQILVHFN